MTWEQIFMVAWLLLGLVWNISNEMYSRKTHGLIVTNIFFSILLTGVVFLVLHCGGFW